MGHIKSLRYKFSTRGPISNKRRSQEQPTMCFWVQVTCLSFLWAWRQCPQTLPTWGRGRGSLFSRHLKHCSFLLFLYLHAGSESGGKTGMTQNRLCVPVILTPRVEWLLGDACGEGCTHPNDAESWCPLIYAIIHDCSNCNSVRRTCVFTELISGCCSPPQCPGLMIGPGTQRWAQQTRSLPTQSLKSSRGDRHQQISTHTNI